ncbi:hypothetical protein MRX96_004777 [Rhipicephalus microplus]
MVVTKLTHNNAASLSVATENREKKRQEQNNGDGRRVNSQNSTERAHCGLFTIPGELSTHVRKRQRKKDECRDCTAAARSTARLHGQTRRETVAFFPRESGIRIPIESAAAELHSRLGRPSER